MADLLQLCALAACRIAAYAKIMIKTMRIAIALSAALVPFAVQAAAPAANPIIALPLQPVVEEDKRACSAKTASGLGYSVLKDATGPKPGKGDFVLVNYIGYLATGGQTFDQNMGAPLRADQVIPGFSEGLGMMPRGATYRFCIPSALGYGAAGAGGAIPANADLVFQVELLDSKTPAEVDALRAQAATAGGAQGAATPQR